MCVHMHVCVAVCASACVHGCTCMHVGVCLCDAYMHYTRNKKMSFNLLDNLLNVPFLLKVFISLLQDMAIRSAIAAVCSSPNSSPSDCNNNS